MKYVIMSARVVISTVLLCFGCQRTMGDARIRVTVIDAGTELPVDSVRVYCTYVDPVPFHSTRVRRLKGLTDENGQFSTVTAPDAFDIIDVEKEGYLPARQSVHGGGELLFRLERVTP